MRLSPEPRTDSNQQSGSAGDPQEILGLSRKAGLGCSVVFQFGLWSLLWEGSISSCPHPAPASPHSFRDRMMSSSRSELSELSAAKETRGLCWVCDTGEGHPCPAHQCSNLLKCSQEICTRAFLPCLQQRLKESSFSKCSSYELAGFSPTR